MVLGCPVALSTCACPEGNRCQLWAMSKSNASRAQVLVRMNTENSFRIVHREAARKDDAIARSSLVVVSGVGPIIRQNPTSLDFLLGPPIRQIPTSLDFLLGPPSVKFRRPWTFNFPWTSSSSSLDFSPEPIPNPPTCQRGIFTRADLREKWPYRCAEGQTSTRKADGCVNLRPHSGSP